MGTWISPNEIECAVPKLGLLGTHGVYVSSNGIDWVGGLQLTYEAERTVESIYPTNGRLEGGTEVVISGTGFQSVNNPGDEHLTPFCNFGSIEVSATVISATEVSCVSPAFTESGGAVNVSVIMRVPFTKRRVDFTGAMLTFTYRSTPTIVSVEPNAGSAKGGTALSIIGFDFNDVATALVRFTDLGSGESVLVEPTFDSDERVSVVAPSSPSGASGGFVVVEASNNGLEFSEEEVLFFFEETVAVTGVVPASVPEMGGTVLTISGSNFVQSFPSALACRIGSGPSVAATWISEELLTCIAPRSSNKLGFEVVEVTTNGIDYTDDEVMLEYRRAITVSAVSPTSGPRRGGTLLEISGEGFRSTDSLTCRFGEISVPAELLPDNTTVQCRTPAQGHGAAAPAGSENRPPQMVGPRATAHKRATTHSTQQGWLST